MNDYEQKLVVEKKKLTKTIEEVMKATFRYSGQKSGAGGRI